MTAHEEPETSPRIILAICCLSLLLVTMDVTIVNVALPALRRDLHASITELQWAVDGYTVIVASLLLVSGTLADRFGRRRMFQVGLSLFTLGSLLCSAAPDARSLIGARMVQAIGGSMLNPVAMSIVVGTFTEPRERARAIGIWGAVFGISMAAGPPIGGLLVDASGWRSIFWVNVPIGVAAIALAKRFIPESPGNVSRRFDGVAQVLIVVGLLAFMSALIDGRHAGWLAAHVLGGFGVGALCLVLFITWEARQTEPLLDPRIFRSRALTSAVLLALLSFASFSAFLFLNSLYLQESRGLRATEAGLSTLPLALGLALSSPLAGRIVGAGHARIAVVAAGIGISVGALLLTRLHDATSLARLLPAYAIFGLGLGSIGAPVNTAAVTSMARSQAGVAAAVASTSRQVGAAIGVALAGALSGSGIDHGHRASLAAATHPVFWMIVLFGIAVVALGLLPKS